MHLYSYFGSYNLPFCPKEIGNEIDRELKMRTVMWIVIQNIPPKSPTHLYKTKVALPNQPRIDQSPQNDEHNSFLEMGLVVV
jgi:hypothetical protein